MSMIVVECKPDAILISSLASISRRRIEHAGNKSRVLRKLMRNYENSIGMVDQDPNRVQPPDMQRFREMEFLERDKLKILYYNRRNNRLVILCPRLEEWIVEASREADIDLNSYNLPNDPIELHEIINIRVDRFQQLVEDLMRRSNRVRALRACLRRRRRR